MKNSTFAPRKIGLLASVSPSRLQPRTIAASLISTLCPFQSLSSPGRRSPLPPRSWGSRRSSWNSLGRAPSLKRRDTSGERESLLSGEGREEEDEAEENEAEATDSNLLRPEPLELLQASTLCPALVVEYGDCNGRTLTYNPNLHSEPKEDSIPEDDLDDDVRI